MKDMRRLMEGFKRGLKEAPLNTEPEGKKIATIKTTVGDLFKWYSYDDPNWYKDEQIANLMTINNEHAKDGGEENTLKILKNLYDNSNKKIKVNVFGFKNANDLIFKLGKDEYAIQAIGIPFEDEDY